jgi:hypothetical protein
LIPLLALAAVVLDPVNQAAVDCVARNAVELGAGNAEPADSVIRAADAACTAEWELLDQAWRGMALIGRGRAAAEDAKRTREAAYVAGFKALTAAREQRPR